MTALEGCQLLRRGGTGKPRGELEGLARRGRDRGRRRPAVNRRSAALLALEDRDAGSVLQENQPVGRAQGTHASGGCCLHTVRYCTSHTAPAPVFAGLLAWRPGAALHVSPEMHDPGGSIRRLSYTPRDPIISP
jgi:hypothetical protein